MERALNFLTFAFKEKALAQFLTQILDKMYIFTLQSTMCEIYYGIRRWLRVLKSANTF